MIGIILWTVFALCAVWGWAWVPWFFGSLPVLYFFYMLDFKRRERIEWHERHDGAIWRQLKEAGWSDEEIMKYLKDQDKNI